MHTSATAPEIMDVNDDAVRDAFRRAGVRTLIHGHTHRPAVHRLEIDGAAVRRIVLGDWHRAGSVLDWSREPELRVCRARRRRPAARRSVHNHGSPAAGRWGLREQRIERGCSADRRQPRTAFVWQ
jgi:hypothetical protein